MEKGLEDELFPLGTFFTEQHVSYFVDLMLCKMTSLTKRPGQISKNIDPRVFRTSTNEPTKQFFQIQYL